MIPGLNSCRGKLKKQFCSNIKLWIFQLSGKGRGNETKRSQVRFPAQAHLTWLCHVSTVVEYLTHNPLAQGSKPAREKVVGKVDANSSPNLATEIVECCQTMDIYVIKLYFCVISSFCNRLACLSMTKIYSLG
jgi:hypothetical protein